MPDQPRPLPGQPNLRYLKLEAKQRLAADGELRERLAGDLLQGYLGLGRDVNGKAVTRLAAGAADWNDGLVVIQDDRLHVRARAGGWLLEADPEPEPPHRLTSLRPTKVGRQVTDGRVSPPPGSSSGAVPAMAAEPAAKAFGELGLAGLVLAGGAPGETGWADGTSGRDEERCGRRYR